ncbi:MAG TPA: hypothetical protein VIM07_07090 [Chitinophagaceae bacterium]
MEINEPPKGFPPVLNKMVYEQALARFIWGFVKAGTLVFIIGKIVGYFGFLSWWYITAPFIIGLLGATMNYLEWIPDMRILLYSIGMAYIIFRYTILRLVLWMPIFIALFSGFSIVYKYGSDWKYITIAIIATVATYLIAVYLSGRSPGMPHKDK